MGSALSARSKVITRGAIHDAQDKCKPALAFESLQKEAASIAKI